MAGQEAYKVIDVFAGPGGLGEGFAAFGHGAAKSKFKLALSIEKDPTAHSTLMLRSFYRQFDPEKIPPEYWSYAKGEIARTEFLNSIPGKPWLLRKRRGASNSARPRRMR